METAFSDEVQKAVYDFVIPSWPGKLYGEKIPWSVALKAVMDWLEFVAENAPHDWCNKVKKGLVECWKYGSVMRRCGLFWIAHYILIKGLNTKRIQVKHWEKQTSGTAQSGGP